MRKLIWLAFLLPCHLWGAIVVGNIGSGANGGSGSVSTGGAFGTAFSCASGNAVAIFVADEGGSGGTITASDSASNSGYTNYGTVVAGTQGREQWFTNANIANSITSVTASFSTSTSFTSIHAYCISGLAASPQDFTPVFASGGFNSAVVAGNFTTTNASEVVLIGIPLSGSATITPSGSWVAATGMPITIDIATDIYQVFTSIQTSQHGSGTLSGNNNWDTLTIGLKGGASAPTAYDSNVIGSEL